MAAKPLGAATTPISRDPALVKVRSRPRPNGHQPIMSPSGRPPRPDSGDHDAAAASWQAQLGPGIGQIHLAEGEFVFRDGRNPQIALVQAGVVRVFIATRPGRELTMQYARSGDLIGVAPYLARTHEWNAEALSEADVSMFTFNDLLRAAALNPELPWRIAEDMATWTTEAMRNVAHDVGHPMRTRVARHLREASLRGPDGRLVAHISQQRFATALGTAREVVCRELSVLKEKAVIDSTAGSVTVIDEAKLSRLAAGDPRP